MEKNCYEAYEYLPANDNETGQFFIVQDNSTFIINRQVQYVAQVQNDKPTLDNVAYDITPQQFLVDVENAPELISVSDQFILPEGENNLYTNGYLIQPEASTEQMAQVVDVSQYKDTEPLLNLDVMAQSNKQTQNCTEITLNDEQYQMLQQKGWILLEINDKIYLLDTLGLHDITTNDKLIHKLKTESRSSLSQDASIGIKSESEIDTSESITPLSKDTPNLLTSEEILPQNEVTLDNITFEVNKQEDKVVYNQETIETTDTNINYSEFKQEDANMKSEELMEDNDNVTRVLVIDNDDICREGSTLKVRTRLSLKNFPDKIVLGKTANGKLLVAKVVKPKADDEVPGQLDEDNSKDNSQSEAVQKSKWEIVNKIPEIHLGNLLNESEFLKLIHHLCQSNINKCNAEDVVEADCVIAQLLQLPAFKATVMDSNLVVTKTVQVIDTSGQKTNKGLSAVVTGKVTSVDGEWHFVHLPYMLQKMINETEEFRSNYKNFDTIDMNKKIFDVLHVQIAESKQSRTNIVKVSVTVNKRSIPMNLILNVQKLQPNTMYACSACASLFKTEDLLKEHQQNDCLEPDLISTTEMESTNSDSKYYGVINGKTKSYVCKICNVKFNKLSTIKNHVKTHVPEVQEFDKSQTDNSSLGGVYKCNMCPCSYFHPSTLSKHILSRHIKIKTANKELI